MVVTVHLTDEELAQIKRITREETETDAVAKAAREFLRISELRQLKAVSGKVDFELNWRDLESMELRELGFPTD
jgi:hypothetical protein